MLIKRLDWNNQENIGQLVTSLLRGNISICTTDTVLGLIAPLTKAGFEKLNELKGRLKKPYLLLIPNVESIKNFSDRKLSDPVNRIINSCWPGPLTLIVKAKESVPAFVKSQEGTVAFRVPDHYGLQSVMAETGPVFSTSANLQGEPTPTQLRDVDSSILRKIAFVVDDKETPKHKGLVPSTILDCSGDIIKVVREGAYSIEALETIAGQRFVN